MAITPIQLLAPQNPGSFTSLLQGSGKALNSALQNAVQAGRSSADNQRSQEQSFLQERRNETNLLQRRAENLQQQANVDRSFGESQFQDRRNFARSVLTTDRDFGLRSERQGFLNRSTAASTAGQLLQNQFADATFGSRVDAATAQSELAQQKSTLGAEQEELRTMHSDALQQGDTDRADMLAVALGVNQGRQPEASHQTPAGLPTIQNMLGRKATSGSTSKSTTNKAAVANNKVLSEISGLHAPRNTASGKPSDLTEMIDGVKKSVYAFGDDLPNEIGFALEQDRAQFAQSGAKAFSGNERVRDYRSKFHEGVRKAYQFYLDAGLTPELAKQAVIEGATRSNQGAPTGQVNPVTGTPELARPATAPQATSADPRAKYF